MAQEAFPLSALKKAVAEEVARRKERRWARPLVTSRHLGISNATLWRWTKEREGFPQPYKHGPRVTCWDLNEIDAFLESQQKSK